jgi:O-antigen ligase
MNTSSPLLKLETALIFLLAAAIFLSKPLIYLSILLLIAVTLVRTAKDQDYRHELLDSKLFWASTGVFVFGLLSTVIGSGHVDEVGWMFRKTMLLLMVVPLLLAFANKANRMVAIAGAVVGFWIAFVLTGDMHNWTWSGERIEGATLIIDSWGIICAMLIVLLTPLVFVATSSWKWRTVLVVTIFGAMVMLITTGARGPWLGVVTGLSLYLLFKQIRYIPLVATVVALFLFSLHSFMPSQMGSFFSRAESITNLETDASNYLRLAMWETGAALITKQLVTGDKGFWFGYRKKGRGELANDFYYNEFIDQAKIKPGVLKKHNWRLTDFHNSYIESVFRNGILWTLGSLFVLAWLAVGPLQRGQGFSSTWAAVPSLLGFLIIGMTYTLLPHFAFLFLIFFMALARGFDR